MPHFGIPLFYFCRQIKFNYYQAKIKKMKRFIVVLLLLVLYAVSSITVYADTYYVTASTLNVRDSAASSGSIVGKLAQGEAVEILSADGKWGMVLVNGDTGYVSMKYLSTEAPDSVSATEEVSTNETYSEPWTDKQKAIFWLCFVIAVGIYIFAIVRVRRGEMVVIKGWLDFGLLVFPWLVVFVHFYDALFGHLFLGKYVLIALYIIAALCLIGSLALSVIANWGSPFNIIFSLIMKLVVIPIMAFGVFYLIFKIGDKTGISRKSIIIFAILGILIGGLMSFDE